MEDKINRYIREKIREAREQRGKTQEDLAKELERSRVAVSNMERGEAQVGASDLFLVAAYLEKPIVFFYPPSGVGARADELSASEQELVWMFRQLDHEALQRVAMSQITALAESATQSDLAAQWEEIKKEAEQKGIRLP